MSLIFECPINSLSFGNVSYNILRELYKRELKIGMFPIQEPIDAQAFDIPQDFQLWIKSALENRWKLLDREAPALKLWHLNGSDTFRTTNQTLFTFHECSDPTEIEIAIAKNQKRIFFSSSYSQEIFQKAGVECEHVPLGFDEDFHIVEGTPKTDQIQFGLMGKFEHRKRTEKIIKLWLKRYGNNKAFVLNLCVTNPFFKPEDMNMIFSNVLGDKSYNNINFIPYLRTNKEVNMFMNMIDVDLTGLSGAEGWNLPSFNASCLGKWSIVLNATAHKDWATEDNCILVQPTSTISAVDGVFFTENSPFNQGIFFDWDEDAFNNALDIAETKCRQINTNGVKLSKQFTYEKTTTRLLSGLGLD